MANEPNKLDKLFGEKLSHHEVKPSQLAWERLESQLPKKEEKPKTYWWAAAAAILVVFASYSLFQSSDQTNEPEFVAEQQELPTELQIAQDNTTEVSENESLAVKEETQEATPQVKMVEEPKQKEDLNSSFLAVNDKKQDESKVENSGSVTEEIVEETPLETRPQRDEATFFTIDRPLIAEATIEAPVNSSQSDNEAVVEEPEYKVTIISNGITEEKDKKFIASLGKTVTKVDGFLGKAGQSYGNLQDAKNNLFTNLISKREKVADKP